MFEAKHISNHESEMPKNTPSRNRISLNATPQKLPQQVAHAHLLKPGKKVTPSNIIGLDYGLWQGDVETFLKGLPREPFFDLIVTSPPYNIGKEYETRVELNRYQTKPETKGEPLQLIENTERFFAATGATFHHGGNRAYYAPAADIIQLPAPEAFKDAESYAATKAHELTHWTKHASRLDRDFGRQRFGDEGYAREELVAELGAAFLCADLGITPEPCDDHAAYIGHWLKVLQNDKRAIFQAAAHAQRAVDYLHRSQATQAEPMAA